MKSHLVAGLVGGGFIVVGCHGQGSRPTVQQVTTRPTTVASTQPAVAAPVVRKLVVRADIDGSDELYVTGQGLIWRHKGWDWPSNVTINGHAWDVRNGPMSLAEAGLDFGPGELERAAIRIVGKQGRDMVAAEPSASGGVVIYFDDSENGAAVYRIELEFVQ